MFIVQGLSLRFQGLVLAISLNDRVSNSFEQRFVVYNNDEVFIFEYKQYSSVKGVSDCKGFSFIGYIARFSIV